jgi:hypothetical protein
LDGYRADGAVTERISSAWPQFVGSPAQIVRDFLVEKRV